MNTDRPKTRAWCALVLAIFFASQINAAAVENLRATNENQQRLDVNLVGRVFDEAIQESESIDQVVDEFTSIATDTQKPVLVRLKSFLTVAHLHWKFGQSDSALKAIDEAIAIRETTDGTLLKARILDANGDETEAAAWYLKAEQSTDRAEELEFIRIRLAMINVDGENVAALTQLAEVRDQAFKNRAAITLAVLGHPDLALQLYVADPTHSKYYQQLIRLAEWALASDDVKTAQEFSWKAYDSTQFRLDALYALSLVNEAYRKNHEYDALLAELESHGDKNHDLLHLRIDLLIDTDRFDDAIALYRSMAHDSSDIEARARLIQLYETAGQTDRMLEEYESLIQSEPEIVEWYKGLATYYLNVAEPAKAEDVWTRFEQNNADSIAVLVLGGDFMKQMGFVDRAVQMVERYLVNDVTSTQGQIFLFETHLARGQDAKAREALDLLEQSLPGDSSDMRVVADSYERLHDHERALNVYLAIEENQERLGYDDQMRLAWLHSVVGNKEESLALWQNIWIEQESPARRSFAEGQFLLIAAELNVLADIVVDLETKLFQRSANKNDVNLLVRIYTEVGDSFSASEIVQEYAEYADISEVDRLRQLGLIYLQLNEYTKYDAVLRKLEQIDPENRIEHIQNIVLNMLAFDLAEETNARYDDIQHWLNELRHYDEEAVSGEFEASVLSMGGFDTEAIESYRRALIEQPTHSDNLLLMADLMKESNRTEEAVSLLQYVAEHAGDDNEFVVAVDGIINMIGQRRFGEQLSDEMQATFRWTQRVILERITAREDKFYLYTLLSDIAQETNDSESQYVAMENSISQAGVRRPSVLRELVTMATPNAGFFTLEQNTGDPERQLIHGRRLIGLRQQLPPDVYIDIARTLLDQDDTLGAEKSLDLVRDITGQLDITKTKANLFLEAGYTKRALSYYSQALSVNRDSLDLLTRTAMLREGNGQTDVANTLYAQAMYNVLRSLPATLQTEVQRNTQDPQFFNPRQVDTSVNRDYRTYFEILMQPLVSTWPSDSQIAKQRLENFQELFRQELANVVASWETDQKLALSRYSRLDHVADFIRRLCFSVGCDDVAESVDLRLVERFPDDEDFGQRITQYYQISGFKLPAGVPDDPAADIRARSSSVLSAALATAIEDGDTELVVRVAQLTGDSHLLVQFFRDTIRDGNYLQGLRYAEVALDDAEYTRLVTSVGPDLKSKPKALIEFIDADPDYVVELEEKLGQRLVDFDELIDLLSRNDIRDGSPRSFYGENVNVWHYLQQQANLEEQLTFLETEIAKPNQSNSSRPAILPMGIQMELISKDVSEELESRLFDASMAILAGIDFQDQFLAMDAQRMALNFRAHPSNKELLYAIVDRWEQLARSNLDVKSLMVKHFEGSKRAAYDGLISMAKGTEYGYRIVDAIEDHFVDEYSQDLESIRQGNISDLDHAKFLLEIGIGGYYDSPRILDFSKRELWEVIVRRFPDDRVSRLQLIDQLLSASDPSQLEKHLTAYYELDPGEEYMRTALYLHALDQEDYLSALAVATDGGPDLRDKTVLDAILKKNDEDRVIYGSTPTALLKRIRGQQRSSSIFRSMTQTVNRSFNELRVLAKGDDVDRDEVVSLLRTLWRGVQIASLDQPYGYPRNYVVRLLLLLPLEEEAMSQLSLYGFPRAIRFPATSLQLMVETTHDETPQTLLEALAEKVPLGSELESYLQAIAPIQRRDATDFYRTVATAYEAHPASLARRVDELRRKLNDDTINDHELTLWLMLRTTQDETLSPQETRSFFRELAGSRTFTNMQVFQIARILSTLERVDEAVEFYLLLASRLTKYNELGDSSGRLSSSNEPNSTAASLLELVKDAHQRLPEDTARELATSVVRLSTPLADGPELKRLYAAFVLEVLAVVYQPDEVVEIAGDLYPQSIDNVDVVRALDAVRIARLLHVKREAGDSEGALSILKVMLDKKSIEASARLDPREDTTQLAGMIARPASYHLPTLTAIWGIPFPPREDQFYQESVPSSAEILIGSRDYVLNGDDRWLKKLNDSLFEWLDDPTLDRAAILELLCVIAFELHTNEQTVQSEELVRNVEAWLVQNADSTPSKALQDFAILLVNLDIAVAPELTVQLYDLNVLDNEQQAALLRALQNRYEPKKLLAVAETAYSKSPGLSVLREIQTISQMAGGTEYTEELNTRIQELEEAQVAIEQRVL